MLAASALSMTGSSPASASPATATPSPVLSQYENPSTSVGRDVGQSALLPDGQDFWIFGDTGVATRNGFGQMVPNGFIPGGTGAEGPFAAGDIPTSLAELPTPGQPLSLSRSNPPATFMPTPTNVYLPDGSGRLCAPPLGQYSARWASGIAVVPNTSDVLITYADVCVMTATNVRAEGWGFMEYNSTTNGIDAGPDDVFPPTPSGAALVPNLGLGSPVFSNGQVSLFSFVCTSLFVGCGAGQVYSATLPATISALSDPSSYAVNPAATDDSTTWQPIGIAVASYPDAPFRMVEATAITGAYNILSAPTPAGPWHLDTTGLAPGCQGLLSGFCYALVSHPELSTSSQLVISYADPGAGPMGVTGPVGHLVAVGASYTVPVPTSPQQLSAVASSTSAPPSVQLSWSPPSTSAPGVTYNVYRSTTPGREQTNLAAPIAKGLTGTSYTDSGLPDGTTYNYVVTAANPQGFDGFQSNEASATAMADCTTYSSPATGSHQVCGPIRAKYLSLGGPSGFLGYPVTDETGTPDGIGRFNHFANAGSIYWTPSTGAWSIHGGIRAKWASLGWETSFLGYPVTDESGAPDGIGRFNHFSKGGSVYWTPFTGTWSIHGAIRDKYLSLGGPSSFLGYPVTDESGTPDGVGRFNHFSNAGSVYWTPFTGAWSIHGAIRAKWASLGWETSFLGYPVTDESGTRDGVGRFNHFSNAGSVYWTPFTGAWSIHGAIRSDWASMGWERSCLGYPLTDEFGISIGRQSNLQGGNISWNASTGIPRSSC
jgi:hypothetical protein